MRPMSRMGFSMPSVRSAAAKLAIALVGGSVVALLMSRSSYSLFLTPDLVRDGQLWQLVTQIPLAGNPLGIMFGGIIIWSMGGALESFWGSKRLLWVVLTIAFVSGLI